jgi:hypothetical protein
VGPFFFYFSILQDVFKEDTKHDNYQTECVISIKTKVKTHGNTDLSCNRREI